MPLGGKVQCTKCSKDESFMWHQTPKGIQCNDCYENEHSVKVVEEEEQKPTMQVEKPRIPSVKKSTKTTRSYKTRQNPNALPKQFTSKGKGRRNIFKKKEPTKLTGAPASYTVSTQVFYKGMTWRSGDIVSVRDVEGGIFYAQIKMFLTDMYCEKSVSISWLLPTINNSPFKREGFDPLTYVLGPVDDLPRKLDFFEFVMHCPPDYYEGNTPYPGGMPDPKLTGCIWGRLNQFNEWNKGME